MPWRRVHRRRNAPCCRNCWTPGSRVHFLGGSHVRQFPRVVRRLRDMWKAQKPQVCPDIPVPRQYRRPQSPPKRAGVETVLSGVSQWPSEVRNWHLWARSRNAAVGDPIRLRPARSVADFTGRRTGNSRRAGCTVIPNGSRFVAISGRAPGPDLREWRCGDDRRVVVFRRPPGGAKGCKVADRIGSPIWLTTDADCDLLIVGDGSLRGKLTAIGRGQGRRQSGPLRRLAAGRGRNYSRPPTSWCSHRPGRGCRTSSSKRWRAGRPVVSTRAEGVDELLGPLADGSNGRLRRLPLSYRADCKFCRRPPTRRLRRATEPPAGRRVFRHLADGRGVRRPLGVADRATRASLNWRPYQQTDGPFATRDCCTASESLYRTRQRNRSTPPCPGSSGASNRQCTADEQPLVRFR